MALGAFESAGVPAAGKLNAIYLEPKNRAIGAAFTQVGLSIGARGAAAGCRHAGLAAAVFRVRRARPAVDPGLDSHPANALRRIKPSRPQKHAAGFSMLARSQAAAARRGQHFMGW